MTYRPELLEGPTKEIREAMGWGVKVIAAALGLGLFSTEIRRILSLEPQFKDYLYLTLLGAIGLKVALWVWISRKELNLFCQWLDPLDYNPPEETLIILGFAVILTVLLFTSRGAVRFGIAYSVYSVINVLGWRHISGEVGHAISNSRARLREESSDRAGIYSRALDVMETYYVHSSHVARSTLCLILAVLGLAISVYGHVRHSPTVIATAYVVFIVDTLIIEEFGTMRLRLALYEGLRPLTAALREVNRAQSPVAPSQLT